jgi:hypothetical protein
MGLWEDGKKRKSIFFTNMCSPSPLNLLNKFRVDILPRRSNLPSNGICTFYFFMYKFSFQSNVTSLRVETDFRRKKNPTFAILLMWPGESLE